MDLTNNNVNNNQLIEDKIILKGLFLGLKSKPNERINFEENYYYFQTLPNDIIQYSINEKNKVVINKIIKRNSFYTIGIVKSIENHKHFNKFYIYTPLLSNNYRLVLKYGYQKYEVGDRIILFFEENLKIKELNKFKNIEDRKLDKSILFTIYSKFKNENNLENDDLVLISKTPNCYYTKNDIIDLTHLNTFNIDPTFSKDFDDAISVDLENNKIYIHIVDINQLNINSDIDKKAAHLGFTLYLSEGNYNMLNSSLSENKFSLLKNEIRQVITVEMSYSPETIDKNEEDKNLPKILNYEIYKSLIKIKERFDYESVEKKDVLENRSDIRFLFDLTSKIYKKYINLPVAKLIINNLGKIERFELEDNSSISHIMIEMLMVFTNKLITQHLNQFLKTPERYHDRTENLNIDDFKQMNVERQLIEINNLRTAYYDTQKSSHFALQLKNYCHFTSPIRRYFDIVVHRLLAGYNYNNLDNLIEHLNNREVFQEKIVNLYENWKLIDYFIDHPTKEFEAKIIKVTKNGIKFYIKDLAYCGFVQSKNILKNIYWKFDPDENKLKGNNYEITIDMMVKVVVSDLTYLSNESMTWKINNI